MGRTSSATTCPVIPFPRPGGPPRSDLPCAEPPGVSPRHRRRRMPRARRRPRAMRPPARCIAPFCLFCEARVPSPCVFLVMPCFFDYLPLCVPSFAARCEIGHFACSRSFSASWSRTCHVTFFTPAQAPKRSRPKEKKKGKFWDSRWPRLWGLGVATRCASAGERCSGVGLELPSPMGFRGCLVWGIGGRATARGFPSLSVLLY